MKKNIMYFWILLGFFMALAACNNMGDSGTVDEAPYLLVSGDKIAINVQYLRTEYFDPFPPVITFVTSKNELTQYYEKNRMQISDGDGNLLPDTAFLTAIEKYSDSYFSDNFLVIVGLVEPSGSNRHKVQRIEENGDIVIKRLLPEEDSTADMAAWSILIELNNDFKVNQYRAVLVVE